MCLTTEEKTPTVCKKDFTVYKVIWAVTVYKVIWAAERSEYIERAIPFVLTNRSEFHDVVYEAGKTYQMPKDFFLGTAAPSSVDDSFTDVSIGYHAFADIAYADLWAGEGQKVVKFTIPKGALYFTSVDKRCVVSNEIVAGSLERVY